MWSKHIQHLVSKANSMIGLIWSNFTTSSAKLREQAFISLVRSRLEYCCAFWDPHLAKDCDKLEAKQWRVSRFVTGKVVMPIDDILLPADSPHTQQARTQIHFIPTCVQYRHSFLYKLSLSGTSYLRPVLKLIPQSSGGGGGSGGGWDGWLGRVGGGGDGWVLVLEGWGWGVGALCGRSLGRNGIQYIYVASHLTWMMYSCICIWPLNGQE